MHGTKAIERHVRSVATRNGLSLKKQADKRYTVSENDGVLFAAPSIDDYFLKLRTGQW
jgi:hypothetical protein